MIIDLSEWNEYIADDVPPGPIPVGIRIEMISITTATSYKQPSLDGYPSGLQCEKNTMKNRIFWRPI